MRRVTPVDDAIRALRDAGGRGRPVVVAAPGRVNVLGEHTDYNEGLCLPAAADLHVVVAAVPSGSDEILVREGAEQVHLRQGAPLSSLADTTPGWAALVLAVSDELTRLGCPRGGMIAGVAADLPEGAGMSSSAAFGIAIAMALAASARWEITGAGLVEVSRHAENAAFGVPCGLLDQMTVVHAEAGCALLLDCRTGEFRHVGLPADVALVVADSGIRRRLAESGYERRVEECREAARHLDVASLRDIAPGDLDRARAGLPDILFRRVRHVVTENARVREAIGADAVGLGRLVSESHRSLSRDYAVSLPAVDDLVEGIEAVAGVLGARIMGAGFGGSILVLCRREESGAVSEAVSSLTGHQAWLTEPGAGARLLEVPDR